MKYRIFDFHYKMGSLYNFYAYNYPAQNPQQRNCEKKMSLVQIIHIKNSRVQDMHNILMEPRA
jgi:hypothetical protein